ncbi:unnamed protein product [Gemmataceae bacterium]|nr:unnamed protein product [Gemmataceae bacterium]VTT99004.1 unnamed protein product [Gemmataceae bacterium]
MPDPNSMNSAFAAAVTQREAEAKQAAGQQAEALAKLTRRYGEQATAIERVRAATTHLGRSLRDGTAVRAARDMAQLTREAQRYRREIELTARYGRVGGLIARHEQKLGLTESAARYASSGVRSLYNRGMSNTVEQGRRELETNLLGREVAAIFKPVSDVTTDLTKRLRKFMEGLGEGGQSALMLGGLGVAGVLGGASLMRGGMLGRVALGGGAVAAGSAAGLGVGEMASGALAAKYLWDSRKAAPPPLPASATPPGVKPTSPRGGGFLASLAGGPLIAALATAAMSVPETLDGGYYEELRKRGNNPVTSMLGAFGGGVMDTISHGTKALGITDKTYGEAFREKYPAAKEAHDAAMKKRTRVTPQGGGFQELGSGYDQIAEAFGKVYSAEDAANKDETAKKTAEMAARLESIEKMVATVLTGGMPTPMDRPGR